MDPKPLTVLFKPNPVMNHPLNECRKTARELIDGGAMVFQKWTCEKCGSRETQTTPDIFFPFGECKCGHVTDIEKSGCNYLAVREG